MTGYTIPRIPDAGQCILFPFKYTFNSTQSYVRLWEQKKILKNGKNINVS